MRQFAQTAGMFFLIAVLSGSVSLGLERLATVSSPSSVREASTDGFIPPPAARYAIAPKRRQVPPVPPSTVKEAQRTNPVAQVSGSGSDCSQAGLHLSDWWQRVPFIATCIRQYYGASIRQAAEEHEVPEAWIVAVMINESEGNPNARSKNDCCFGLMQLEVSTASEVGVTKAELLDPNQNIHGGTRVLARHMKQGGSFPTALMWYRFGPTGATRQAANNPTEVGLQNAYVARTIKILGRI